MEFGIADRVRRIKFVVIAPEQFERDGAGFRNGKDLGAIENAGVETSENLVIGRERSARVGFGGIDDGGAKPEVRAAGAIEPVLRRAAAAQEFKREIDEREKELPAELRTADKLKI